MLMDYVFAIAIVLALALPIKYFSDRKRASTFWFKVVNSEIAKFELENPEFIFVGTRGADVKVDRLIYWIEKSGDKKFYVGYGGQGIQFLEHIIKKYNAGEILKYYEQTLEKFKFPIYVGNPFFIAD